MNGRWLPLFFCAMLLTTGVALFSGPDSLSILETSNAFLNTAHPWHALVFSIRLPRVLLALLVGAALGVAGTLAQGIFRNPLADPSVIGVSMGAALAASISLVIGLEVLGLWVTPLAGALGGMGTLLLLFALTNLNGTLGSMGNTGTLSLLLGGVAISAFFASLITVLLSFTLETWEASIKVLTFLMGSFEGRVWIHLLWALPPCVAGIGLALYIRTDLDLLLLGEESAQSLGIDVAKTQRYTIIAVGLLVGATTALVGVIGFLSLVIPHAARLLVGPQHRMLVPASAFLGATVLLLVDTLARGPLPVPPGALCSALGAPFLLFLLRRTQNTITAHTNV